MVIDEQLEDPVLESKAKLIFKNIKCSVCQGQAIDESDTAFARDLRKFIRDELKSGKSQENIEFQLTKSFGENIIFTPKFELETYFLWTAPFLLLLMGIMLVKSFFKK